MRNKAGILTAFAFLLAAGLSFLMALAVGMALESRSQRHVQRALVNTGLSWVDVSANGLLVTLSGTAPSEAMRYRASIIAGRVVGASRIADEMDVTPSKPLTAPRFSLELLRNDDGISVIGLAPTSWDPSAFIAAAKALADEDLTNMVETADFAIPAAWDEAITFGLEALRLLPRSKISIAADGVRIHAIADSPDQKHSFESALARSIPRQVPVNVQISAPRPVIAPFTLRFVLEEGTARFDACSADTERARMRITAAGRRAGVPGAPACVLGLGVPSPRWADAAEALIAAVKELGAGMVSISDVDVTLIADPSVSQADFDRVIGELTTKLPDVFSLKATLTPKPQTEGVEGPAQFTATLSPEGRIELRGRVTDERMRALVDAFARARFGAQNVYVATRLDDQLPPSWGSRVLASLAALAEVSHGSALVEPASVALRGVTGNTGASAEISRLLSDRLGQGARYSVDVTYNERLDPSRGLPSPAECLARTVTLLSERQITFAPNEAEVVGEAARVVSTLAEELEECAAARLEIGGHTDSQGRAESNLALSQRRAEAVLRGLEQRGIDTSMMSAKGYGAAEPIADNATEEGRVANRRIAFKLVVDPNAEALSDVIAPADPEDDGEALPSIRPQARPGSFSEIESPLPTPDEIPELADGEEPMGEAGDLEVGPDGEPMSDAEALDEDTAASEDHDDTAMDATEAAGTAASETVPAAEDTAATADSAAAAATGSPSASDAAPASGSTPEADPVEPAAGAAADATLSPQTPAAPAESEAMPEAPTVTPPTAGVPTATASGSQDAAAAPEAPAQTAAPEAPAASETPAATPAPESATPATAAPPSRPEAPSASEATAPAAGTAAPALAEPNADAAAAAPSALPASEGGASPPAAPTAAAAEPAPEEPAAAPEPEPEVTQPPPLPPGWGTAPDVPDLRPLPRPKEFAQ